MKQPINADHAVLDMPCGNCGAVTQVTFGELKKDGGWACKACGQRTDADSSEVQQVIDNLNARVGRKR